MKIACLGWGSLIWDPRDLPILDPWFSDGPLLPIEFARHSKGDRITLVIVPGLPHVRVLWALMSVDTLEDAKVQLTKREGISIGNISKSIGWWSKTCDFQNQYAQNIGKWAEMMDLDAVVWTALRPKFMGEINLIPAAETVVSFFKKLPLHKKKAAEEYVRMAPLQVNTKYRRKIEEELNWTPSDEVLTL